MDSRGGFWGLFCVLSGICLVAFVGFCHAIVVVTMGDSGISVWSVWAWFDLQASGDLLPCDA